MDFVACTSCVHVIFKIAVIILGKKSKKYINMYYVRI